MSNFTMWNNATKKEPFKLLLILFVNVDEALP